MTYTVTVLDVENTVTERDDKTHLDPFEKDNKLVQVGVILCPDSPEHEERYIVTFHHQEIEPNIQQWVDQEWKLTLDNGFDLLQDILDSTDLMVGHNLQHDLGWLWECGFNYRGKVYDTMIGEYLLQRGQKQPLSLDEVGQRRRLPNRKKDTLFHHMDKGQNVDTVPFDLLTDYLHSDLLTTRDLYYEHMEEYAHTSSGLRTILDLSNELCIALAQIYCKGVKVDTEALMEVGEMFTAERDDLKRQLDKEAKQLMGDTPINLGSPAQLSRLVFSREPKDKKEWPDNFTDYMDADKFKAAVAKNTYTVYKTKAHQCKKCHGAGKVFKMKKDGNPHKRPNNCKTCDGVGVLYKSTGDIAGLRFNCPAAKWVTANGFATNKLMLELLAGVARSKGMEDAESFLTKMIRLSALDSYLSNFVGGIAKFTKHDGILHVSLSQTTTGTGRLSGRNPNMQNMPRSSTFPVKKCFVSRWKGGQILEADFAQLEFRAAAFLAQDPVAMEEVSTGFDVHAYTARIISEAGQPTDRQHAKAHTFAPLYGATGYGRTPAEAAYYQQFTHKYYGIGEWHTRLADEVMSTGKVTTPSGREFAFPFAKRRPKGGITYFTQVKNYPVQSFATADLVPLALLAIHNQLREDDLKSVVVNTVHDSIVIDVHPGEVDKVLRVIEFVQDNLHGIIERRFDVDMNVPLLLESKLGENWLETREVTLSTGQAA